MTAAQLAITTKLLSTGDVTKMISAHPSVGGFMSVMFEVGHVNVHPDGRAEHFKTYNGTLNWPPYHIVQRLVISNQASLDDFLAP
jgi:hypothetical protein